MKKKYTLLNNTKRTLKYVKQEDKRIFAIFGVYTLSAAVLPFFGIVLPKLIIDGIQANLEIKEILTIILWIGIPFVVLGFCTFFFQQVGYQFMTRIRIKRLSDIVEKLMTCDYKYTEDTKFLDEQNNAFSACDNNTTGFEGSMHILFTLVASVLSIVGYIYIIATLNVWILLYLLLNIALSYYLMGIVRKYRYKKREEIAHANRKLGYFINTTQDFAFGKDIRLNQMEQNIIDRYDVEVANFISIFRKIFNKQYLLAFGDIFMVLIREGLVYGYLIYAVLNLEMTIGDFSLYFATIATLSTAFTEIINNVSNYVSYNMYVGDLFRLLDDDLIQHSGTELPNHQIKKRIEFKKVSFKYPRTDKYIIKDFDLVIEPGERLAIVGINGAGKTTLIKLLCGLYEEYEGEILVDGVEIKTYNKDSYYQLFSVVFQNFKMFAMSIEQNVALEAEGVNQQKVLKAIEQVGMKKKVDSLDKGLQQQLLKILDPEGIELSGGENQKLAIARALYKDRPIVILDEPTAALDALAEAEIYQNFDELVQGKTTIYISHRLASTQFCDNIVLLGTEGILEYGTHEELLKNRKEYYEMFMVQAQYYQEGKDYE